MNNIQLINNQFRILNFNLTGTLMYNITKIISHYNKLDTIYALVKYCFVDGNSNRSVIYNHRFQTNTNNYDHNVIVNKIFSKNFHTPNGLFIIIPKFITSDYI